MFMAARGIVHFLLTGADITLTITLICEGA